MNFGLINNKWRTISVFLINLNLNGSLTMFAPTVCFNMAKFQESLALSVLILQQHSKLMMINHQLTCGTFTHKNHQQQLRLDSLFSTDSIFKSCDLKPKTRAQCYNFLSMLDKE